MMIATLSGIVKHKLDGQLILDVNGVGYGLLLSSEDYGKLEVNKPAELFIYEHIRENSHDLYGFCNVPTKQLFELLLAVNGIGPRMALNVLSIGTVDEVRQAIASGDIKFIQLANGVGKRVAERVVVDLKDKVGLESTPLDATGLLQADSYLLRDEAVEALVSLGYSTQDAVHALKDVPEDIPTTQRVTQALKVKS